MKYVIKSCDNRLWYVQKILIPDMLEQGIKESDIVVMNDDGTYGCLKNWLRICEYVVRELHNEEGAWHLQDDVLISSTFKDVAENVPRDIICNGFGSRSVSCDATDRVGYVPVKDYWMSFPCFYAPNSYIKGFLKWFDDKVINEGKYRKQVLCNRYEDMLFWNYVKERHKDEYCLNIVPNVCQHVDEMLGGSVANNQKKASLIKSDYWLEEDRENELLHRIERIRAHG